MKKKILLFVTLCFFFINAIATEIAITIDDFPIQNLEPKKHTPLQIANQILSVLEKHHLTGVYGFINGGNSISDRDEVFKTWINHQQLLGNHTFSHLDLNKVSAETYISDIKKNEPILINLMKEKNYKFFRYPYLATAQKNKEKHDTIFNFLIEHQYTVVPVTINFEDYLWHKTYARCVKQNNEKAIDWLKISFLEAASNALTASKKLSEIIYQREIKFILLIHIQSFTANRLDELLTLYEKQGVKFISLQDALQDHVYHQRAHYIFDIPEHLYQDREKKQALDQAFQMMNDIPKKELKHLCRG